MKTILVPTDFSACSNSALEYAAMLAKKTNSSIHFLHVLDVQGNTSDASFMVAVMKVTKSRMKQLKNDPVLKDIDVRDSIEVGPVSRKVNDAAKKLKADIIVLGTHGASGFRELFIGSNAERIVRDAMVPVLSIKTKVKNADIKSILFASDFSEEAIDIFPTIKKFMKILDAKLNMVKVVTKTDFETTKETKRLIHRFQRKTGAFDFPVQVYYDDSKPEGIRRFAATIGADMIALGTHGRHGLSHFFNGSIAEDLVNHVPVPVLTVNIHKKNCLLQMEKEHNKK